MNSDMNRASRVRASDVPHQYHPDNSSVTEKHSNPPAETGNDALRVIPCFCE
jgi:hypothetical protein